MATEKRDRQRANRQLKQIELAKQEQRRRTTRRGLIGGLAVLAGLALVIGLAAIGGAFSDDDDGEDVVSTSVASADSTPASFTYGTGECPPTDGAAEQVREFAEYPPECIDASKTYTAEIVTNKGAMTAELFADRAPIAVNSFVTLARYQYFDGISCHRIIPNFVAQCGDPTGTGTGGPGYEFPDELPAAGEYEIGSLAMANSGANTNGSQFFVITGDDGAALPPNYTLFGRVTEGLDTTVPALDAVGSPGEGVPTEEVTIESVTITES